MADFIGNINPFRYRGYYYDSETKLYYLQSRYYDAEIGRFINGDEAKLGVINSISYNCNLYSYCDNDSVNKIDYSGFLGFWIGLLIVVGAGVVVALIDMNDVIKTKEYKKATDGGKFMQLATAFLYGFFKGAGSAFFTILGGIAGKAILAGLISCIALLYDNIDKFLHGKKMSKKNFTKAFSDGYTGNILNTLFSGNIIEEISSYPRNNALSKLLEFLLNLLPEVF